VENWSGPIAQLDMKRVAGGLLVQDARTPTRSCCHGELKTVTDSAPTPQEMDDLLFAWRVAKIRQIQRHRLRERPHDVGVGAGQSEPTSIPRASPQSKGRARRPAVPAR